MDKGSIKRFATSAREKLLSGVTQKAYELGITKDEIEEPDIFKDGFLINQQFYKAYEIEQRDELIRQIKQKGFEHVIEEVAYTWFNRLIALRYMEVNDYLPTGVRIFSSIEEGKKDPDALTEVEMLIEELDLDRNKVYELQDANDDEDLFKYILVKQCNKLGEIMPMIFERIEDYTELLIPNQLLVETSVIYDMVTMIDEVDWTKEVEIIGWLYQYYISDKKDEVFADLRKNIKISKENIPAVTELFTPRWIVQYMVDNSLGQLWLESHPNDTLKEKLSYYLEGAEQPENVMEQLEKIKTSDLNPEAIRFLDPSMGSGHILVYAFEVFYEIYKSKGYREQDIPKLIIENNLYGLDIDPRATQLACFAVMMKARGYNYRLFDEEIDTNLHWIDESNLLTDQDIEIFIGNTELKEEVQLLIETFKDAKLYGSIIEVPEINIQGIKERITHFRTEEQDDMFVMDFIDHSLSTFERLIDQAEIVQKQYDVVVTNPPYMGRRGMDLELAKYVRDHYKDSSADLYAVFMELASKFVEESGFIGLINQHSWMFLSSFEKLRKSILANHQIYSMAHLGTRAFSEIGGEVVQTTSFVMRKGITPNYLATFVRLTDYNNAEEKTRQFFNKKVHFERTQDGFSDIPGSPIAYWASDTIRGIFKNYIPLGEIAEPKAGLATGDNPYFQRFWYEVFYNHIGYGYSSSKETKDQRYKWFPCESGGNFRKWYGNKDMLVNWFNDGEEIKNFRDKNGKLRSRPQNVNFYFKKGITWNKLSTNNLAVRYKEMDTIYDDTSRSAFPHDATQIKYVLGLLSSNLSTYLMSFLSPTLSFTNRDISRVPFIDSPEKYQDNIDTLVNQNISISKSDWDSYETSWDFKQHPFIEFKQGATKLADAYNNWKQEAQNRFQTLKANEEELNRIFIDLYGLQDELTPDVPDEEVTVSRADLERDVKSFLSYGVGLMFGRYSLDEEGLAFAGGKFELNKYRTFKPDEENVIPITDESYFEDDIVTRFIDLLRLTFGKENLEKNLEFIADALTRRNNETARERVRRYFLREFYKDHVRMYKKRPIYWMFESNGRQNGFKALIYLHRYDGGLASRVRTEYLHELQKKYEDEIKRMDFMMESDLPQREKTRARKQKEKLQKQLLECQTYDQVIAHVAYQRIDLDLDDGVKVNYDKFQNIEVSQGEGRKPIKANTLARI